MRPLASVSFSQCVATTYQLPDANTQQQARSSRALVPCAVNTSLPVQVTWSRCEVVTRLASCADRACCDCAQRAGAVCARGTQVYYTGAGQIVRRVEDAARVSWQRPHQALVQLLNMRVSRRCATHPRCHGHHILAGVCDSSRTSRQRDSASS